MRICRKRVIFSRVAAPGYPGVALYTDRKLRCWNFCQTMLQIEYADKMSSMGDPLFWVRMANEMNTRGKDREHRV